MQNDNILSSKWQDNTRAEIAVSLTWQSLPWKVGALRTSWSFETGHRLFELLSLIAKCKWKI